MKPTSENRQSPERLSETELRILECIAERIFPQTETPGALECGAVDYIQVGLDGDYADCLPLYRQGLGAVDRHARRRFAVAFTTLEGDKQDSVLADFEAGRVADFKKAAEFFETVRYHVLEGVFCEPQYGGNRDMIGWRLVNFPGQQFGYPDAYINKQVDLPPVAIDPRKAEKD
jgi:gluconate 2-dehydrogenase gamma chain